MNDVTIELQALIDRMQQGDRAARRELLERSCRRLRLLTARLLHGSFPTVQARHEVDSVVHETWLRLQQTLETAQPPTVADFFRLAAHKIRQVLLDMVAKQRRGDGREGQPLASGSLAPREGNTYNPTQLAMWSEFHERAAALPDDERIIFELHHYLGLPQAEIARVLELHPREVSRRWVKATERLADGLGQSGIHL